MCHQRGRCATKEFGLANGSMAPLTRCGRGRRGERPGGCARPSSPDQHKAAEAAGNSRQITSPQIRVSILTARRAPRPRVPPSAGASGSHHGGTTGASSSRVPPPTPATSRSMPEASELLTQAQQLMNTAYDELLRKIQLASATLYGSQLRQAPQFGSTTPTNGGRVPDTLTAS
jgi:hypothetical protein